MRTIPVYSDYKVMMECVKVEIDRDHYILFTPKSRKVETDGKVFFDNYVEIKIVDETVSDCLVFEAKTHDISQHIKVMQDLIRQVSNMPTELECDDNDDEQVVYPNDDSCGLNYTNKRLNVIRHHC